MRIFVQAKPNSKKEYFEKIGDNSFVVAIKELPRENEANFAIIKALAKYFKVSLQNIRFVSGAHSKKKILEII